PPCAGTATCTRTGPTAGARFEAMGRAAAELGHEWAVLTDHSPSLKVARGLSPERLREQLRVVAELNARWAPFRLLTGIECDILLDGSLDQEPELLEQLDLVVGSVHSKLRMESPAMTRRLLKAVRNPLLDVLGHCTGRLVTGRTRPESVFDAEAVFAACAESGTAVEVNSRPERLDPPRRLLRMAVAAGTLFAVDTDAHAPGQLDWQILGCARAAECGVPEERVVNTWPAERLLAWTGRDG
ncbi:PHP domain-containing protein, partial [Streptomyces sp. C]